MVNTTVKAGVCGFTSRIFASSEDEQNVSIRIETDCEKIRKLADSLPVLDSYSEIQTGHEHLAGDIVDFGARGDGDFIGGADGDNLAARDDEHAAGDGLAGDGDDLGAGEDLQLLLGTNTGGQSKQRRQA